MWQVALGWHAMKFAKTSTVIGILHLVSILTISLQSTCHSAPVCGILSKLDHTQQKKMTSCWFSRWRISAILDVGGPIIGSLKSPCTTFYRSWIETIALNCLVFEKIAFLQFGDRQTNIWTPLMDASHEAALAVVIGGLTNYQQRTVISTRWWPMNIQMNEHKPKTVPLHKAPTLWHRLNNKAIKTF